MKRNVEPLRTNKRHRDILGNPQPGTRQMLRGQRSRFHSSPFDEVPAAIRPRQRVNVEYHRRGNGVSLFLRWEGRKGRNVTIGSERSPSRGEEIRSSTIRVVYAKYRSLFCLYLSLSLLSRENSWIQSERGISAKGLFLSRNNTCGK